MKIWRGVRRDGVRWRFCCKNTTTLVHRNVSAFYLQLVAVELKKRGHFVSKVVITDQSLVLPYIATSARPQELTLARREVDRDETLRRHRASRRCDVLCGPIDCKNLCFLTPEQALAEAHKTGVNIERMNTGLDQIRREEEAEAE